MVKMEQPTTELTIGTIWIGRHEKWLPTIFSCLENLDYPKHLIHLLWLDNSGKKDFSEKLQTWLDAHDWEYLDVDYLKVDFPKYEVPEDVMVLDENARRQMEGKFITIANSYDYITPYIKYNFFSLEDDILIPPLTLKILMPTFEQPDVGIVSGIVYFRHIAVQRVGIDPSIWDLEYTKIFPEGDACLEAEVSCRIIKQEADWIQQVGATHLGCTLIKKELLDKILARQSSCFIAQYKTLSGCDIVLGYYAKQLGYKVFVDWTVKAKHLTMRGEVI